MSPKATTTRSVSVAGRAVTRDVAGGPAEQEGGIPPTERPAAGGFFFEKHTFFNEFALLRDNVELNF